MHAHACMHVHARKLPSQKFKTLYKLQAAPPSNFLRAEAGQTRTLPGDRSGQYATSHLQRTTSMMMLNPKPPISCHQSQATHPSKAIQVHTTLCMCMFHVCERVRSLRPSAAMACHRPRSGWLHRRIGLRERCWKAELIVSPPLCAVLVKT